MLFTDLGSYVHGGKTILPLDAMLRCGVEATCNKGAQELVDTSGNGVSGSLSIQQARSAGFRSNGLFYWDLLSATVPYLLDYYSRDIDLNNPDWISTDHEEWQKTNGTAYDPQYISDHGQALCEGLQARYPDKVVIPYTAEWVVYGHAPAMVKWLPNFDTWIAWWSDNLQPRYRLTKEQIAGGWMRQTLYKDTATGLYVYKMIQEKDQFENTWPREAKIKVVGHQYSSRILFPYDMVGGTVFDHQNDMDYTPMTIDEWIAYTKGVPMPANYRTDVPEAQRASIYISSKDDKNVNVSAVNASQVAGVVLGMVYQNGPSEPTHAEVNYDSAWRIRHGRVDPNIAKFGMVTVDGNWLLWIKGLDMAKAKARTLYDNETMKLILQNLRKVPFTDQQWANHTPAISATDGGWMDVQGVVFFMYNQLTNPGGAINGEWQMVALNDLVKQFHELANGGWMPRIPLYLMAPATFFKKFDSEILWKRDMDLMLADGRLKGLIIAEEGTGVGLYPTVPMANPGVAMDEVLKYKPLETYRYSFVPAGQAEKIACGVYTWSRMVATDVSDKPLMMGVWSGNQDMMYNEIGFTPTLPPPPPTGETVEELKAKLAEWKTWWEQAPK